MFLLVNLMILLAIAIVVFLVAKYILKIAEADPDLRRIVLIILLLIFVVMLFNVVTGFPMWPAFYQPTTSVRAY